MRVFRISWGVLLVCLEVDSLDFYEKHVFCFSLGVLLGWLGNRITLAGGLVVAIARTASTEEAELADEEAQPASMSKGSGCLLMFWYSSKTMCFVGFLGAFRLCV